MLVSVMLFALAYLVYGWVMRLRSLILAIIIGVVLLVVTRFVLYR